MFMDSQRAFGCGQCDNDVRTGPLREIMSNGELELFIYSELERSILMIPRLLFSITANLKLLTNSPKVMAVIVYDRDIPANDPASSSSAAPTDSTTPFTLPIEDFSVDDSEPNRFYNHYSDDNMYETSRCDMENTTARNRGSCLKYLFFPFNVFFVSPTVAKQIQQLSKRFPGLADSISTQENVTSAFSPRFKVESVGRMFACPSQSSRKLRPTSSEFEAPERIPPDAMTNSSLCLKDKTCSPIGGQSLWSSLDRLKSSSPGKKKVLAITTAMDSLAFFPHLSPGASAEITSVAVMMAIATAVGEYRRRTDRPFLYHPTYFAFNAQSWGYTGSSRFLKDVKEFECEQEEDARNFVQGCKEPYMKSIKFLDFRDATFTVLNIGQLITPNITDTNANFTFFTQLEQKNGSPPPPMGKLEMALMNAFDSSSNGVSSGGTATNANKTLRLTRSSGNTFLPIDASQSFRKFFPEGSIDMVSISNYDYNFTSTLYHTLSDTDSLTAFEQRRQPVYRAAEAIAKAIISLAFGDDEASITINKTIIDSSISCLAENWSTCDLAREYLRGDFNESEQNLVSSANQAGIFLPVSRLPDRDPSSRAKLQFLSNFFAYHNRIEDLTNDAPSCNKIEDCDEFARQINEEASPTSQTELLRTFCTLGQCVASDTYEHNAFGTALIANNTIQTKFLFDESLDITRPREPGWSESGWPRELGICGVVQDTFLFSGLIFGAGVVTVIICLVLTIWFDRVMQEEERQTDNAYSGKEVLLEPESEELDPEDANPEELISNGPEEVLRDQEPIVHVQQ